MEQELKESVLAGNKLFVVQKTVATAYKEWTFLETENDLLKTAQERFLETVKYESSKNSKLQNNNCPFLVRFGSNMKMVNGKNTDSIRASRS